MTVKDDGQTVATPITGTYPRKLRPNSSHIRAVVKVKPATRLAAIRHHVARGSLKSAGGGHFENDSGETISLDKSVDEVKGNATICKLVLSLSPSLSSSASEITASDLDSSDGGSDDAASTKSSS